MKLWIPRSVFGINYQLQILQIGPPGPPGLPRGDPCILGKFTKNICKNICAFSAKVSCDLLKLTPERRDTSDGRKKLIHQPAQKRKVGKKGVIIDVKITKHQFLHGFESARGFSGEAETIYIYIYKGVV